MLVLGRVTSILGEGSFWRKAMWICWSCNDSQMMVKLVFEIRLSAIWQFCYVRYVCLRWILVLYTRRVTVQELGCLPSTSMCVMSSMERSHILSLFLFCLVYIAFWFCQLTPLPINRSRPSKYSQNSIVKLRESGWMIEIYWLNMFTPPKTNMEPENGPLERRSLLETIPFRFHVKFRGCML